MRGEGEDVEYDPLIYHQQYLKLFLERVPELTLRRKLR